MVFGVSENLIPLIWPVLPQRTREYLTNKIERFRFRSNIKIPENDVKVFVRSKETLAIFPGALNFETAVPLKIEPQFSVVMTCKDEGLNFERFLSSMENQSTRPLELIICDAGMGFEEEGTISKWTNRNPDIKVEYFKVPGINISKARNESVKRATQEIILFADCGTLLDKDWAENLITPFYISDIDACFGWYFAKPKTDFQVEAERMLIQKLDTINTKVFIPSTRSLAIKKSKFLEVGGFEEVLTLAAEDSLFGYFLKKKDFRLGFSPDARVEWYLPKGYGEYFLKIFKYSKGDAETGFLFWNHYYILMNEVVKLIIDILVIIILGFALSLFFSTFLLTCSIAFLFIFFRISFYLISFASPREFTFRRILTLIIHSTAQVLGFISGIVNLSRNPSLVELVRK